MRFKNRLGRPVSGCLRRSSLDRYRPVGHLPATLDMTRDLLSLVELTRRISIKRIPVTYGISKRAVDANSVIFSFAVMLAVFLAFIPAISASCLIGMIERKRSNRS